MEWSVLGISLYDHTRSEVIREWSGIKLKVEVPQSRKRLKVNRQQDSIRETGNNDSEAVHDDGKMTVNMEMGKTKFWPVMGKASNNLVNKWNI